MDSTTSVKETDVALYTKPQRKQSIRERYTSKFSNVEQSLLKIDDNNNSATTTTTTTSNTAKTFTISTNNYDEEDDDDENEGASGFNNQIKNKLNQLEITSDLDFNNQNNNNNINNTNTNSNNNNDVNNDQDDEEDEFLSKDDNIEEIQRNQKGN
ncbi:hypothetical protein ACTFIV_006137 [Dictyostelium citrinum]